MAGPAGMAGGRGRARRLLGGAVGSGCRRCLLAVESGAARTARHGRAAGRSAGFHPGAGAGAGAAPGSRTVEPGVAPPGAARRRRRGRAGRRLRGVARYGEPHRQARRGGAARIGAGSAGRSAHRRGDTKPRPICGPCGLPHLFIPLRRAAAGGARHRQAAAHHRQSVPSVRRRPGPARNGNAARRFRGIVAPARGRTGGAGHAVRPRRARCCRDPTTQAACARA